MGVWRHDHLYPQPKVPRGWQAAPGPDHRQVHLQQGCRSPGAGGTLDDVQRQAAYVSASQLIRADEAVIPLYQRLTVDARKIYLQGWQTNVDEYVTWNIQDWWLNQ